MHLPSWLGWIGLALQLLGLGAAAVGVWQTQREYAPERLGLWRSCWQAVLTLLVVLRLRTHRPQAVTVEGVDSAFASDGATVLVLRGPFPEDSTVDDRLTILLGHIRELDKRAADQGRLIVEEGNNRERDMRELHNALGEHRQTFESALSRAMAGGLNLQAWASRSPLWERSSRPSASR